MNLGIRILLFFLLEKFGCGAIGIADPWSRAGLAAAGAASSAGCVTAAAQWNDEYGWAAWYRL